MSYVRENGANHGTVVAALAHDASIHASDRKALDGIVVAGQREHERLVLRFAIRWHLPLPKQLGSTEPVSLFLPYVISH